MHEEAGKSQESAAQPDDGKDTDGVSSGPETAPAQEPTPAPSGGRAKTSLATVLGGEPLSNTPPPVEAA